jgi:RNA polymerase sigma factor (sigma-70 family)
MCEKDTNDPSSLPEGSEGSEKHEPVDRRRLAKEFDRLFPGIDHEAGLKLAFNITRDFSGAEDVLQTVYLSMTRLPDERRREIEAVAAYVATSIRREAYRWVRRYRFLSVEELTEAQLPQEPDFVERLADEDQANFMLSEIPEYCREAYVLFNRDGYTVPEISRITGDKIDTLKKRLVVAAGHLAMARQKCQEEQGGQTPLETPTNKFPSVKESRRGKH